MKWWHHRLYSSETSHYNIYETWSIFILEKSKKIWATQSIIVQKRNGYDEVGS